MQSTGSFKSAITFWLRLVSLIIVNKQLRKLGITKLQNNPPRKSRGNEVSEEETEELFGFSGQFEMTGGRKAIYFYPIFPREKFPGRKQEIIIS